MLVAAFVKPKMLFLAAKNRRTRTANFDELRLKLKYTSPPEIAFLTVFHFARSLLQTWRPAFHKKSSEMLFLLTKICPQVLHR